ncbi:L-2-hydroxyglutarate oxidase [Pseudomonas sp. P5_152]|jgi:L-2-hydroxyglutarate oxidase|uniref:L-2-hydroxyglutarate oxidase n=1 Tax=unclassified Pseudomonas TaxID=196821 RepID=UPI000BA3477E|nr:MULTISPECIES: L-2-hydroxyglutarate oxidase [unclassified Pseudomonas]MDX9663390.1 L-2-hydroxyglutarate oxidase [Pseudomonas sp. P5_152]QHD01357.1 hydroxyglutarate oxidase [Pseudomonas sp. S04]QHF33841.1 hydroxyglutarate oxidase [Pseudomonas sp. S19]
MIYDYCIIGGGIVGLATAMALLERQPGASLLILEKEAVLAQHQTGHNSGVIHAGIYYAPGSLKADLCKRGAEATKAFCIEHQIKFDVCGKLLVASTPLEVSRMHALYERSKQNGLKVEQLDAAELRRREPNIVGLGGLFLDATGIVDYRQVCQAMARVIEAAGGEIRLQTSVTAISESADSVTVSSLDQVWQARQLVACAGLQSDRLAKLAGVKIDHQIIPFRGEYYRLPASRNEIVNHLIYPIPDPELPFLGVHLTRMIDGSVTVGPNAVLGLGRENYRKFSINWRDVAEYASFPGFWKTIWNNLGSGTTEMKNSLFKRGYLEQCRKYCPSLEVDDLLPYEAGIRAQAVMRDGTLVHDFLFAETPRMVHVCNAPSPAATSAIPIGQMIAEKILKNR